MSEQQLHNTPPDAGARNRAPTEPEPPLSPPPTPSTTSTSPETPASPASSRRPAKTRRQKQPARDIKPTATTGQADTPSEIASEAPPIEPEKKPTSGTKRRPT